VKVHREGVKEHEAPRNSRKEKGATGCARSLVWIVEKTSISGGSRREIVWGGPGALGKDDETGALRSLEGLLEGQVTLQLQ